MDQLLSKAGSTLVTFAVRSGVQIASTYVVKSVGTLIDHVPEAQKKKVERIKRQLQNKIEIVTYSIEIIQLMAARGNTNLTSVLNLANDLEEDIKEFHEDIAILISDLESSTPTTKKIQFIEASILELIEKIDNLIPLLNLTLTTSGANVMSKINEYVSPGRLLNATVSVNQSNELFHSLEAASKLPKELKVGSTFSATLYDVFYNHNAAQHGGSEITWKEKYAKCSVEILRIPHEKLDYCYEIKLTEDLDDDRYHDPDEESGVVSLDMRQIARLFFSASGKLLKLQDRSSPVLVLKVKKATKNELDDLVFTEESKIVNMSSNEDSFSWIAIGHYEVNQTSDSENDSESDSENDFQKETNKDTLKDKEIPLINTQGSSLALLEYIIRLCALQTNDQQSLLKIKDERLRLYLADENSFNTKASLPMPKLKEKMENLKL